MPIFSLHYLQAFPPELGGKSPYDPNVELSPKCFIDIWVLMTAYFQGKVWAAKSRYYIFVITNL